MDNMEDFDIKLAVPKGLDKPADEGEESARAFQTQKDNGNMDKAKELGRWIARAFLESCERLSCPVSSDTCPQAVILYSYAVNKAVGKLPNSMLAQAALNTYYDVVEERAPRLYDEIKDPISFSFYLLQDKKQPGAYGNTFARMCGHPEDGRCAAFGDSCFSSMYNACLSEIGRMAFAKA